MVEKSKFGLKLATVLSLFLCAAVHAASPAPQDGSVIALDPTVQARFDRAMRENAASEKLACTDVRDWISQFVEARANLGADAFRNVIKSAFSPEQLKSFLDARVQFAELVKISAASGTESPEANVQAKIALDARDTAVQLFSNTFFEPCSSPSFEHPRVKPIWRQTLDAEEAKVPGLSIFLSAPTCRDLLADAQAAQTQRFSQFKQAFSGSTWLTAGHKIAPFNEQAGRLENLAGNTYFRFFWLSPDASLSATVYGYGARGLEASSYSEKYVTPYEAEKADYATRYDAMRLNYLAGDMTYSLDFNAKIAPNPKKPGFNVTVWQYKMPDSHLSRDKLIDSLLSDECRADLGADRITRTYEMGPGRISPEWMFLFPEPGNPSLEAPASLQ